MHHFSRRRTAQVEEEEAEAEAEEEAEAEAEEAEGGGYGVCVCGFFCVFHKMPMRFLYPLLANCPV
jgi:hypothetical protein